MADDKYDWGPILHALGGLIFGGVILLLYRFHTSDVYPFTICFALIFPLRELFQHPKGIWERKQVIEWLPAVLLVGAADIIGRLVWGADIS